MSAFWWIGSAGLLAIEGSYMPQIARLHRLKQADELSYFFPGLNFAGRILALTYSVLEHQSVFTIGFIVGAALRLTLLGQVSWYRARARRLRAPPPSPLLELDAVRTQS